MNTLHKGLVIAVASLGLGTVAIAASGQSAPSHGGACHWGGFGQQGAKSAERMAKRQAAMHDKLQLTAAQEPAWQSFTAKMQATVPAQPAARPTAPLTAPERADRMAAFLQTAQQQAAIRAQSIKDFYAVLSPEQQKTFDSQLQGHHHHFGHG